MSVDVFNMLIIDHCSSHTCPTKIHENTIAAHAVEQRNGRT